MSLPSMSVDLGGGREGRVPVTYPSNSKSDKVRPEKPAVEQVTTGKVVRKRKGISGRLAENIGGGEEVESVAQYILLEVLIPAAKNMISDAVSQGMERLLFGESRPRSTGTRHGYTPYNRARTPTEYRPRDLSPRARATHDFDDIILDTKVEADEVLEQLAGLLDSYEQASVSDLYDLVGITGNFTDTKWGWTDMRGMSVRRVREGYKLILPKTQPLD